MSKISNLRLLSFTDASHGNASGGSAQIGHIICATDYRIHSGDVADVSIFAYKSHKNPRSASSTLLNESTSFSETLADAEWIASWFGLCRDLNCATEQEVHTSLAPAVPADAAL